MKIVYSKIRNKEYVEVTTKYDRTIINTVIIELVDNNYHYGLIFCYGNACAASPYDANLKFKTRDLALEAGLNAMINNHKKWLSEAGDALFNYKKELMESVINKSKQILEGIRI